MLSKLFETKTTKVFRCYIFPPQLFATWGLRDSETVTFFIDMTIIVHENEEWVLKKKKCWVGDSDVMETTHKWSKCGENTK